MTKNLIKNLFVFCAVAFLAFVLCAPCFAQQPGTLGTPPFTASVGGPFDKIDPANLNVTLAIPVIGTRQGRGLPFNYNLVYNSLIWMRDGGAWTPVANWGWSSDIASIGGYISWYDPGEQPCYGYDGNYQWVQMGYTEYAGPLYYTDADGVSHTADYYLDYGVDWPQQSGDYVITDGCSGNYDNSNNSGAIYDDSIYTGADPSGTVSTISNSYLTVPVNATSGAASLTDRNGNQITNNGSQATDTLGNSFSIGASSASYTAPSGATATYNIIYTGLNVMTAFGCSGVSEYSAPASLVTEIDLPDQATNSSDRYVFTYEPTPGHAGYVTGRIASVQLPTGGVYTYQYSDDGGHGGTRCGLTSGTATLARQTPDTGTSSSWSYAYSNTGTYTTATTITDPLGNQTVMDFNQLVPMKTLVYSGSSTSGTLLETTTACYTHNAYPNPIQVCDGSSYSNVFPFLSSTTTAQWPGGSPSKVVTQYVYGQALPTEVDEYDYGASSPTRKTITSYWNSTNLPTEVKVEDGSGTVVADTQYQYDQSAVTPTSGTPQFVSGRTSGNVTTIRSLVSGSNWISRTMTYFDTGMVQVSNDFNGNPTTYAYSSTYGGALPTTITNALNQTVTKAYDTHTGLLTSTIDPNNQTTSYHYDDMLRPTEIDYPDGGQTALSYSGTNEVDITQKIDATHNLTGSLHADGLGRTTQEIVTSDPEGDDYLDTAYDSLGRVHTVSNPYRTTSDPTYGLMYYSYDPLGRPTFVTDQDNSMSGITYSTNCATATDEAGKARKSCTDALGRVTQVVEDPTGLNYETDYQYDALDNLICAAQKGTNTGSFTNCASVGAPWRPRTFIYDDLSRLISSTNPESGATSYTYDNNGNVHTKTSPLPNQTGSSTVTTTYTYDALNRLTEKDYTDGTPSAFFSWDGTGRWGVTQTNTKGRLGEEWTGTSCCSSAGAQIFSYDSMGRLIYSNQYTVAMGNQILNYAYDLAGDMTSGSTIGGAAISYSYDAAQRLTSVTSSLVDASHPATLASNITYSPMGGILKMTYGNGLTGTNVYNKRAQPCLIDVNSSSTQLSQCSDGTPTGNLLDLWTAYNEGSSDNGNVAQWNATGSQTFIRTYSYDGANRLASLSDATTSNNCNGLTWSYDAWGNRTAQSITPGGSICGTWATGYNSSNQITNSGFAYDAAGNLTHDGVHQYFYDAENRIIQVDGTLGTCSTAAACYLYDALGHRVEKQTGSVYLSYVYAPDGNVEADWCNNCAGPYTGWARGYVYLNGQQIAEYGDATTYFIHKDRLGSTRLITGLNGSNHDSLDFLPFGEQIAGTTVSTHEFTGYERDSESNLDNAQARYYASSMGRFMSPDPYNAGANAMNPQSWNMYSYVNNNPLNAIDPTGMDCAYINQDSGAWAGSDTTDPTYPTICDSNDAAFYIPGNITGYTGGPYTFEVQYCPFDTNFYTSTDGGPSTSCEPVNLVWTQISVPRPPSAPCEGDASTSNPCSNQPQPAPGDGGGGGGGSGGAGDGTSGGNSPTLPLSPQIIRQTLLPPGILHQFCGRNVGVRILKSMRIGAVVGLIRGATIGFAGTELTTGEFTFGLSGVGGAAFGGTVGTIAGAGGGVFSGFALAEACQSAGAYK